MSTPAKRAYDRAWRARNRARTRAYDRDREPRQRLAPRGSRAAYFRAYRAAQGAKPRPIRLSKLTKAQVASYRAARAAEVEARLVAVLAAEVERAKADAELGALIREQERDAKRYQVKYGPEFLDVSPTEWAA